MKITTYATKKRTNSFIRPDENESAVQYTVLDNTFLKDNNINMSTPSFYIAASNYPETSYCILSDYEQPGGGGRVYRPPKIYYFITGIRHDALNRWWIDCKLDVLATWKDHILSQTAFVEYSSSDYSEHIIDSRYPTLETMQEYASYGMSVGSAGGNGFYVLGVTNNENSGEMVTYYGLNQNDFNVFKAWLFSDSVITDLMQKFGKINACIISCAYFPFPLSDVSGATGTWIQVGNMTVNGMQNAVRISPRTLLSNAAGQTTMSILHGYTDYRKAFELHNLYLPFVGVVPIAAKDLYNLNTLHVLYSLNIVTGEITYRISAGTGGTVIGTYSGQASIKMAVTEYQSFDAVQAAKSLISAVGLAVVATVGSGVMAIGAAAGGIGAGINTMLSGVTATTSQIGSVSGSNVIPIGTQVQLFTRAFGTPENPDGIRSVLGRPCFKTLQLNTLTGYVKTKDFRCQNSGYMTFGEVKEVEDILNNEGAYI